MEEDDADVDDWLIQSIRIYSDLHLFELQDPSQVIEWTSDKSICVAGYKAGKTHEILELRLPQKLFTKESQGLCPERDFKVGHGGFSEEPIRCLEYVLGTRCVVTTSSPGSDLQIWHMGGDDTDVIKRTGSLKPKSNSENICKLASGVAGTPCVLHGSQTNNIQLTDLTTGGSLYTAEESASDAVSSLRFVDANVFLVCAANGDLCIGDIRDPSDLQRTPAGEMGGSYWCMGLKKGEAMSDAASCTIARLSCSSHVLVSDLRNVKIPARHVRLDILHKDASCDFLCVTWAPALNNCLAVSGFNGLVYVYDTSAWTSELTEPQSQFVHRGHVMSDAPQAGHCSTLVTTHTWHPWRPRTVLSAGTDGSLHVWDWVDKEGHRFL